MMRTLQHLRDFLGEEALKFLPGNILTGQFILLRENVKGKPDEPWRHVVHVFDQGGTYIGTIEHPDWIPTIK